MRAGRYLGLMGLLLACGCGGGAAAGGGPESGDVKPEPEPAVDGKSTPADEPSAKAPESEAAGSAGGSAEAADAPLDDKEIEGAMQSLLSDAELLDNLQLKKAGRSPLKVSGAKLPAKLKVIAGSHEVKVVPEPTTKKAAVLVFTKVEREGGQIKLHYRFDIEELEGRAALTLKSGNWELTANRVMKK